MRFNGEKFNTLDIDEITDLTNDFENANIKLVMGRNYYSNHLLEQFGEQIYFVENNPSISEWQGRPVFDIENLPIEQTILVASGGRPRSAMTSAFSHTERVLHVFDYRKIRPDFIPEIYMNEGFGRRHNANHNRFQEVMKLIDKPQFFESIINFRRTEDLFFMNNFIAYDNNPYFDNLAIDFQAEMSFVDVGSFNAYDSLEFIKRFKNYREVIALEPNLANWKECKINLQDCRDAQVLNIGLGSEEDDVAMHGSGSTSKIMSFKDESFKLGNAIKLRKLDHLLTSKKGPLIVKMDVEGFEHEVLKGAKETIDRNDIIWIIAAYHQVDDFWKILEPFQNRVKNFKIDFYHFGESIYESFLFLTPKELL